MGRLSLIIIFPEILVPLLMEALSLRIFSKEVFPAPEDPIMYRTYPGIAMPETPFMI